MHFKAVTDSTAIREEL